MKINLSEWKASQVVENPGLDIEGENEVFHIDPPQLWPDEAEQFALAKDNIGLSTLLLGGPEVYARFKAEGGTAAILGAMIGEMAGVPMGKSSPSSAS